MCARKGETGEFGVVKLGSEPAIHGVALLAVGRKVEGGMVGICGLLELRLMARDAGSGKTCKLAGSSPLMTCITGQCRMRPNQGKSVLMLLDIFNRDLPAFNGVTFFAFRPHLSAMDIGVAVGARVPDIGEHQLRMTLRAGTYGCVHAAQRVSGFAVIEVRYRANRLPTHTSVACLARNPETAMRTSGRHL